MSSGVWSSCTPRPSLPLLGFTTSGYSEGGICSSSRRWVMNQVVGKGRPLTRASAAATALSRTRRMARASLMVTTPAAATASRMLRPGPSDTVFSTQAS